MNFKDTIYLGFLEDPEENNDLSLQNFPSFSGGVPLWLQYNNHSFPPEIKCQFCDTLMKFVLQIFAPFKDAFYRYIQIFVCMEESCQGKGVRAIRTQLPFHNDYFDKSEKMLYEDEVRFSENNKKYLLIHQQKEIVNMPLEHVEFVEINKNNNDLEALLQETNNPIDDISHSDMDMKIETSEPEEDNEEDILNNDIDFIIFKRNIESDPEHVLRYCFDKHTTPLFYSSFNKFNTDKIQCKYCKGQKFFEFQLNKLSGFEWGIVAVYSCYNSCFKEQNDFYEEDVFVQNEPNKITQEEIQKHKEYLEQIKTTNQEKPNKKKKKKKVKKEEQKEIQFDENDWVQLIQQCIVKKKITWCSQRKAFNNQYLKKTKLKKNCKLILTKIKLFKKKDKFWKIKKKIFNKKSAIKKNY